MPAPHEADRRTRFSLRGLAALAVIAGPTLGAFLSSYLPFVTAMASILFLSNLFGAVLAVRPTESRSFWLGFSMMSWGIMLLGYTMPVFDAAARQLASSHGYTIMIQPAGNSAVSAFEIYFLPAYESAAATLYRTLTVHATAFTLGIAGGLLATWRACPGPSARMSH